MDDGSEVSRDTVYSELYNEMRRFRDYEFTSSTWYTALQIAILGFVLSVRFGYEDKPSRLAVLLTENCAAKVGVIVLTGLVCAAALYLVHYSVNRYFWLRSWVDENLEPAWKKAAFQKEVRCFGPRHILYATQLILFVLNCATVLWWT